MSRKVKFIVGYSDYLLVTMAEAEKLASILDGKQLIHDSWVGNERYSYVENEPYSCQLAFETGYTEYHSEQDYRAEIRAEEEARAD